MSAAAGVAASNLAKTWSIGPVKIQVFDLTIISGDTTAVCTGDRMRTAYWAFMSGPLQTAAPTYSNGAVTFTFADPTATKYGQAIVFGV